MNSQEDGRKDAVVTQVNYQGEALFELFCHIDDPIHFQDAIKEENWVVGMEEEIEAIEKNDTSELMNLP